MYTIYNVIKKTLKRINIKHIFGKYDHRKCYYIYKTTYENFI